MLERESSRGGEEEGERAMGKAKADDDSCSTRLAFSLVRNTDRPRCRRNGEASSPTRF